MQLAMRDPMRYQSHEIPGTSHSTALEEIQGQNELQ
jgi:hypothetical protein